MPPAGSRPVGGIFLLERTMYMEGFTPKDLARKKAQQLSKERRYKKPILSNLNFDFISNDLMKMMETTSDVRYFCETEEDSLLESLVGDEDDAFELKMMVSQLDCDLDQLSEDLSETWIPDNFDLFIVRVAHNYQPSWMEGFDDHQGDYYGLNGNFERKLAVEEAEKQLMKLKKKDLIEAAEQCFMIAIIYIALKSRYDDLKSSIDIIRGKNAGYLKTVKAIENAYEAAEQENFRCYSRENQKFEELIKALPDEAWVQ
jgi:hypothetical protein